MTWRDLFNRDVRDEARTHRPGGPVSAPRPYLLEEGEEIVARKPWEPHEPAPEPPPPAPPMPTPPRVWRHLHRDTGTDWTHQAGEFCDLGNGTGMEWLDAQNPPREEESVVMADPARGLFEALTGQPLPMFAELRARYGDPAKLPPVNAAAEMADGEPLPTSDVPEVNFRDMLRTEGAWSVRNRLEVALGRPWLATKIAEELTPDTGARLCDRLEKLLEQAADAARAQIAREMSNVVDERIRQYREEQDRRRVEVTRERFARSSRLD